MDMHQSACRFQLEHNISQQASKVYLEGNLKNYKSQPCRPQSSLVFPSKKPLPAGQEELANHIKRSITIKQEQPFLLHLLQLASEAHKKWWKKASSVFDEGMDAQWAQIADAKGTANEAAKDVVELKASVQKAQADASKALGKLEEQKKALEAVEGTATRAQSELAAFKTAQETRDSNQATTLTGLIEAAENRSTGRVNGLRSDVDGMIDQLRSAEGAARQALEVQLAAAQEDITNAENRLHFIQHHPLGTVARLDAAITVQDTLVVSLGAANTLLNAIQEEVDGLVQIVNPLEHNTDDLRMDMDDAFVQIEHNATQTANVLMEIEELRTGLQTQRTQLEASMGNQRTALDGSINNQRTALEGSINNQRIDLEARLDTQRTELEARIGTQRTDLENSLNTQRTELEDALSAQRTELDSSLTTQRNELEEGYKSAVESARTKLQTSITDGLEAAADAQKEENRLRDDATERALEALEKKLSERFEARVADETAKRIEGLEAESKLLKALLTSAIEADKKDWKKEVEAAKEALRIDIRNTDARADERCSKRSKSTASTSNAALGIQTEKGRSYADTVKLFNSTYELNKRGPVETVHGPLAAEQGLTNPQRKAFGAKAICNDMVFISWNIGEVENPRYLCISRKYADFDHEILVSAIKGWKLVDFRRAARLAGNL